VRLASYTTLGLGGPARAFSEVASAQDVVDAVRSADTAGEPVLILGGGSNLVVADEGFDGTVVYVATRGIEIRRRRHSTAGGATAVLRVQAGEDWDALVARCVAEGLAGVECLAGIPGLAGATPIQNVGAYGQEVAETITTVRAFDRAAGEVVTLDGAACGFGYRTSRFKRTPGRFAVLEVTFELYPERLSRPIRYPELASALGVAAGQRAPLGEVRDAVLGLRRSKGMVLDPADPDTRSAGSFFTNPVLGPAQLAAFEEAVRRGHKLFTAKEENSCVSCHGDYGRKPVLRYDVWGTVAKPANLVEPHLKGGARPPDVYARVRFGIPAPRRAKS